MIKTSGSIVDARVFTCDKCHTPLVATKTTISVKASMFGKAAFRYMTCPASLEHSGLIEIPDVFAIRGDESHKDIGYSTMPSTGIAYAVEFMQNSKKPYSPRRFLSSEGYIKFFSDVLLAQGWVEWYEGRKKKCRVVSFEPQVVSLISLINLINGD